MMDDGSLNQIPEQKEPNGVSLEVNEAVAKQEVINPFVQPSSYSHKTKNLTLWTTIAAILVLIFIGLVGYVLIKSQSTPVESGTGGNGKNSGQNFSVVGLDQLNLGQLGQLDINGLVTVNGGFVLKPSAQPEEPLTGQLYFDEDSNNLAYYDGQQFQTLASNGNSVTSIGGSTGAFTLGAGLLLQGNTLSAETINSTPNSTGVTSLQGQSGAVILKSGSGIGINGTTISNTGVTALGGAKGNLAAGRGLSVSGKTLLSTVSLTSASATLIVTDDGDGNYTISEVGSGSSGSVALGPALAQTDASNFPSISIDKTGIGNLIEFSVGGVSRFVVGQGGAITTGSIAYSQITGLPQIVNNFTDGSSNTATGAIILGSGLALSGNTIINTASGGIAAVNGTANQVNASTNLGVVTLSTPQDINTNSTPQFSGLTLTGLGAGIVQSSAGGVLSSGSVDRNSGTLFTNQLSVANGGTGSNSAGGARTNLGAAASGANSDITSLSGLTTALSVGQGGTGATNLTQNGVLVGNGVGAISSVATANIGYCLTSTAGAPTWSACPGSGGVSSVNTFSGAITIQGTLNQVTVSNNTGTITISLPQDINTSSSPQFSSMTLTNTLSVQGASATIGTNAQSGSLILNDGSSNTGTLLTAALGQNVVYTLPDPGQGTATICLTTGNCAGAGSGVTTGGGTSGVIPVFTASQNIEDSTLSQSGSVITASGSVVVQGALGLTLGTNNSIDGIATFNNDSGTHTVSLQAPNSDPASNLVFRLPSADGSSGDCLKTNSSGVLSFGSCLSGAGGGSGGVISLNGLSGSLTLANASGAGATITIDNATTAAKGIASFNSSFFNVSSGAVSLATGSVTSNEIANGTITGTDVASSTIANSNLVNSSVSVNAGTGLSGGGSVALGSSTSLSVSYGGTSGTAVQGNTTLTCPSGTGNLTGGGTSITLGNGGTCADLNTIANPTFSTSVTTAEYIFTGAGSNGSLKIGNLGQVTTYTLPDPGQATASICLSTGNCAGAGAGVTTSGGTTNAIAKFTGSQSLGDSSISDNGSTVTVGVNLNVSGAVTLSNQLTVGNGGTGATTFTSNGILYGNGTGALQATAAGATGECLIGNTGAAPSWGSCAGAAGGVSSLNTFTGAVTIQGTANQVVVNNSSGTITLSLPQSINTTSSPQFTNLTLSGNLTVQGGTGTFGTTSQAGSLVVYDGSSNTGTIQTAALGQNTTYTLPDPGGASANICLSTGNCAGAGTGVTTTGGTTNTIPKFTGSQALGDSTITDNAGVVTTSSDLAVNGGDITSSAATLTINAGGAVDIQDSVTVDSLTADTGNINITSGVLQTAGTTRLTNGGVLQNVTNADASTFFTGGSLTVARGGTGAGTFTSNGVIYGNGTSALGVTAAGTTGQCLVATTGSAPSWGSCAGSGSGATLQAAYNNGNSITTTDARDIDIVLANTTTDSNLDIQVADDSTSTVSIARVDGTGTNNPSQLLLIENQDTNQAIAVGIRLQAAGGGLTTGVDVSDNEIGTAVAIGTNNVTVNGSTIEAAEFALLDGRDNALVDTNDAVNTAITGTGALNSGSITSGFGTIDNADTITGTTLNGTTGVNTGAGAGTQRIDASGNLVNIGDAAINGGDITSTAATLVINAGGNVDIQDAATVDSLTADTGNVAITSGALTTAGTTRLTNGGALQNITGYIQSSGTFATTGISSFSVDGTTGATYAFGASATTGTITLGGTGQTGTITIGQSTDTNTINIGNAATGAGKTQSINIGTGGSGTSTTSVSIGSTTGGTTYLYGNTYLANLNSANNTSYLCQNSFGYLASCNTTGTGAAFVQGGNSYATTAVLGTNDSNSLTFETNNATQATIAVGGGTTFKNSADSATAFRIQNVASNNFLLVNTLGSSISVGDAGIASTIQIGNTTGAVVQTINVGNNGTASSSSNVVIGSTIGGTTTLQSQGGTVISTLGTADNTNYLCRNTSNIIATCNAATVTLQGAYDADADGSDSIITLSTADDGIIIRNPSSSGSDSTYNLTLDQLSTGAKGGLSIQSAGTGNLLLVTDTTATARDVLTIADKGWTTFRNQTDDTASFKIQNAAGTNTVLNVDTTNGTVKLASLNNADRLALDRNDAASKKSQIVFTQQGSTRLFSAGTDLSNNNTNNFYIYDEANSTNRFLIDNVGNIGIGPGISSAGALLHVSGASGGTGNTDLFKVTDTTATARDVLTIADGGAATFRNQTNSTTTFQIQNAAGTNLLNADTVNMNITSNGNLLASKASQTNQQWSKVSGTAGTIGGNNSSIDRAYTTVVYNGSLYVGTNKTSGAEVYRYDGGSTWTRVTYAAGQIINGYTSSIDEIRDMVVYNGNLYIGTNKSNSAEVYKYDGSTWSVTNTTPGSFSTSGNSSINQASRMIVYNGSLYMGTDENNGAEIYRYDGGSGTTAWTRVSYDGTHIANGNTQTPDGINGFAIVNNQLYVGSGDGSVGAGLGAVVFRYDGGTTWTAVSPSVGSLGGTVTNINFMYGFATYNDKLYVGTRKTSAGQAEVYRYDGGTTWTVVSQTTAGTIASGGTSGIEGINRAAVYNGRLYIATGGTDNAEVYRYDGGTTWTKITQTTAGTVASGGTSSIDANYALGEYNGSLYVGTGETAVAEIYKYSDNLIEGRTSDTAGVFSVSTQTGTAALRNSTNSTTAFQIQNASSETLFNVDTTNSGNISLLGNNGGVLGAWTRNSNSLSGSTNNAGTAYSNGYVYLVGGNIGGISTTVQYAQVSSNGSVGSFTSTTALPLAREDIMAVASNGYLYAIGGYNSSAQTTAYYAQINKDGTIGSWNTTTSLPASRFASGVEAYNGYIYIVAGSSASAVKDTYYAKQNADGSLGAWTLSGNTFSGGGGTNLRRGIGTAVANGYLYAAGGEESTTEYTDVYYSKLNTDGSIGTWTVEKDKMPGGRSWGALEVVNGYMYFYGGYDGTTSQDEVYYTTLNSDGSTGAWNTNAANMLINESDFSSFSANGFLYGLGMGTGDNEIHYVSTPRVTIGGSLDLVGLSGENLAEGGSGGALTAGNTKIVGTLDVQDQANFQQGVSVKGNLTVQSGIYSAQDIKIGRQTNSGGTSSDWTVTNGTAGTFASNTAINSVESMVVYNGSMYIGTYDSTAGNAEVYRYDENANTYTLVSSTGFGNSVDRIQSMVVYNGYLYAGTQKTNGAEVYRYDGGTTWTAVTGTAGTIGGNTTNVDGVFGMAVWHGKLYIGSYASGGLAELYRYDGSSTWADLTTTAGNICGTGGNDYLHELEVFQDQLYAATFGGADICRYDGGTTWTRVNAASGQIATGGTTNIQGVESMAVFNGALYAGTYNDDGVGNGHAEIYRYDGGTAGNWVKVSNSTAGTIASGGTSSIDIVATLVPYNGKLYAGTWGSSGSNPDKAEVYVFDPVANSWSKVSQTTAGTIRSSGTANINGVVQMIVYNNKLYAGTGESNSAEVYKFNSVSDQSYALKFSAGSNTVSGTEQPSYYNEGSIYFAANLQGTNTNDYGVTGSFVFSNGITTATGSYDVAEDYPTRDGSLKPGDVVSIDPDETGFVQRSYGKSLSTLVGVYSEKPGLRLSQSDSTISGGNAVPVALAGRVPVNVTNENGVIEPGDFLTSSSTPGYAMKATQPGPTIGKALGSFSGNSGKVLAFVNVGYYSPSGAEMLQTQQIDAQTLKLAGDAVISGDLNVSGKSTLSNLYVSGDTEIDGSLTVANATVLGNISVGGHIITTGDTPEVQLLPAGGVTTEISVVGNDTSGTITIDVPNNEVLTDGDIAKLIFTKVYGKAPRVVISPVGPDSAKLDGYVTQSDAGFVLGVSTSPSSGKIYKFNYFVVE